MQANRSASTGVDLAFTMNPYMIQPGAQPPKVSQPPNTLKGTISLANNIFSLDWDHTLVFQLVSSNPGSKVTVSNLMQYQYPTQPTFNRVRHQTRSQ